MTVEQTQNPEFLQWLMRNVKGTVLDIGCGDKWYHSFLDATITSIDAWPANKPDILLDIEKDDLPFLGKFDVVLFLDVIEHLSKKRGLVILEQAKRMGHKLVVLTPLGFDANEIAAKDTGNAYQRHKSLWAAEDFKGFRRVRSVESFKPMVNRDPKYIWGAYLGVFP